MRRLSLILCLAMLASCGTGNVQVKPKTSVSRTDSMAENARQADSQSANADKVVDSYGERTTEDDYGTKAFDYSNNKDTWLDKYIEDACLDVFPSSKPVDSYNMTDCLNERLSEQTPPVFDLPEDEVTKLDKVKDKDDYSKEDQQSEFAWNEKYKITSATGFTSSRISNGRIIVGENLVCQNKNLYPDRVKDLGVQYTSFKMLSAFSLKDGKKLWSHESKALIRSFNVCQDAVFVETEAENYCLDVTNGKLRFGLPKEKEIIFQENKAYEIQSFGYANKLDLVTGELDYNDFFKFPKKNKYYMNRQGIIFRNLKPYLNFDPNQRPIERSCFFSVFIDDYAIIFCFIGMGERIETFGCRVSHIFCVDLNKKAIVWFKGRESNYCCKYSIDGHKLYVKNDYRQLMIDIETGTTTQLCECNFIHDDYSRQNNWMWDMDDDHLICVETDPELEKGSTLRCYQLVK